MYYRDDKGSGKCCAISKGRVMAENALIRRELERGTRFFRITMMTLIVSGAYPEMQKLGC